MSLSNVAEHVGIESLKVSFFGTYENVVVAEAEGFSVVVELHTHSHVL